MRSPSHLGASSGQHQPPGKLDYLGAPVKRQAQPEIGRPSEARVRRRFGGAQRWGVATWGCASGVQIARRNRSRMPARSMLRWLVERKAAPLQTQSTPASCSVSHQSQQLHAYRLNKKLPTKCLLWIVETL